MLQNGAFPAKIGVEHVSFISKKTEKFIEEKPTKKGLLSRPKALLARIFIRATTAINIT